MERASAPTWDRKSQKFKLTFSDVKSVLGSSEERKLLSGRKLEKF